MNSRKDKIKKSKHFEELVGEDFIYNDYIEKVESKCASLIGKFLIEFSLLEHSLDIAIAEFFADDLHEIGYTIIEKLTFRQKVDLFYKLYMREEVLIRHKITRSTLVKITQKFRAINDFRNELVHANWESLKKDGTVRTKIIVDKEGEGVKFKRVKITSYLIQKKINEIDSLISKIDRYKSDFWELEYKSEQIN